MFMADKQSQFGSSAKTEKCHDKIDQPCPEGIISMLTFHTDISEYFVCRMHVDNTHTQNFHVIIVLVRILPNSLGTMR